MPTSSPRRWVLPHVTVLMIPWISYMIAHVYINPVIPVKTPRWLPAKLKQTFGIQCFSFKKVYLDDFLEIKACFSLWGLKGGWGEEVNSIIQHPV